MGTKREKFGTVSTQMLRGPILEKGQREKAKEFIGGNTMNIVKGDRVVLLEGKDKGKIGLITEVDVSRAEFTVEGLNMVCSLSFRCNTHFNTLLRAVTNDTSCRST